MKLYLVAQGLTVKRVYVHKSSATDDARCNGLTFIEAEADLCVEMFDFDKGLVDLRLFGSVNPQLTGSSRFASGNIPDKRPERLHTGFIDQPEGDTP